MSRPRATTASLRGPSCIPGNGVFLSICLGAVAIFITGCGCILVPPQGIGSTGTDVVILNATTRTVTVTEVGQNSGHDLVSTLNAGEERVALWHFTSGSKVTLRAASDTGTIIYCHQFTYEELRPSGNRVLIEVGQLDCS